MLGMRPTGAWFILLLGAAACGRSAGADQDDPARRSAETPVEAFFRYGPVALGASRVELAQVLGEPDSVEARPVTNLHDPAVTDSVVTLHYPGLVAEIYRASYDGRELLSALSISDARYLRPESPLEVGMDEHEVRLLLGEPASADGEVLDYPCTSCDAAGYDVLELRLGDGQLRQITLRYWID